MEFACLSKLTSAVFEIILTCWLIRAEGEFRAGAVRLPGSASSVLDVQGVVVLTRVAVFAAPSSEEVTALKFTWPLREGGCTNHLWMG